MTTMKEAKLRRWRLILQLLLALSFTILSTAAHPAGQTVPLSRPGLPPPESPPRSLTAAPLPSLAKQLALGVKKIVIDAGHGGKDWGAISCHHLAEKDLTLILAKALKENLETSLGCKVILTRSRDQFLTLEERTRIANEAKADLFISIHVNAHVDTTLTGIETFSLNFAKDQEAARVAALENAPSRKSMSDLKALLEKLMLTTKLNESAALARQVQRNMVAKLRAKGDKVRDLGVKQAPFRVLLGAGMPSILIETGFITNSDEESRLQSRRFQQNLVKGITTGIESYIWETRKVTKAGERS